MKNTKMLENMVLFPKEGTPTSFENISIFEYDDEPMEVNDSYLPTYSNNGIDDEGFEVDFPLENVTDGVESRLPEKTFSDRGLFAVINSLIQDEQHTIESYNEFLTNISTESNLSADSVQKITQVIEDIIKEENVHVGQLLECQKLFNPNATSIDQGRQEASTQLSERKQVSTPKSLFEEIQSATFMDPKVKPTNANSSAADTEEMCTLADTDDEF